MTTIILAAGLSERMGENKLLLPYKDKCILSWTVESALGVSDKVIIVVGHEREQIEKIIHSYPVEVVFNEAFIKGQNSSAKCGIMAVSNDDFSILPGDLPLLEKEDFLSVFEALEHSPIARGSYKGIPGHPVAYRRENREKLLAFPGSMKDFLKEVGYVEIETSLGSVYDIDTKEKYTNLLNANGNLSILNVC